MDKIIKIAVGLFAVIIFCAALVFAFPGTGPVQTPQDSNSAIGPGGNVTVYFFYGEECPHCHNIMPFMQSLQQKYPDVNILFLETWHNQTNQALSVTLNRELKVSNSGVPEVIVGNVALIGEKDIPAKLEQAILDQLKKKR
nr:thioredoxin domain-containing protein [uncultured Methanoregula sp.]